MRHEEFYKRFMFVPVIAIIVALCVIGNNFVSRIEAPYDEAQTAENKGESGAVLEAASESGNAPKSDTDKTAADGGALLDLNSASLRELDGLPEIGEARAKAIVEQRQKMGGFRSVEDVLTISGIGTGVLEKFKDKVTVLPYSGEPKN